MLEAALRRYFRKRVMPHEVDDLVQEVFMGLHARRANAPIETIGAYIFTIASNLLKHRARSMALAPIPFPEGYDAPTDMTPERIALSRDQLDRVRSAIAILPPRTRDVFLLHRFEEMTYPTIAKRLGISVSAVEKHIIAALRALRAMADKEP